MCPQAGGVAGRKGKNAHMVQEAQQCLQGQQEQQGQQKRRKKWETGFFMLFSHFLLDSGRPGGIMMSWGET